MFVAMASGEIGVVCIFGENNNWPAAPMRIGIISPNGYNILINDFMLDPKQFIVARRGSLLNFA